MLHLASAAAADHLRAAALPGSVQSWPLDAPATLAEETEEIVLWFGPEGRDQRAMLAAVAACPAGVPVSFILTEPALDRAEGARLTWLFHHRPTAGPAFFRLCAQAWQAAQHPDAAARAAVLPQLDALPTVQQALREM